MGQLALPRSDVSVQGWTPTPVWRQIDQQLATVNDQFCVTSSGNPNGDTFVVSLDPLDPPSPGTQTLTVRMQATNALKLPVTIQLFQSGNTLIATRIVTPTQGFTTYNFPLTPGEAASITDYHNLSVEVTTTPQPITRRSLGTVGTYPPVTSLTLPSVWLQAGELLIVDVGAADVPLVGVTFAGTALTPAVMGTNAGTGRAAVYYLPVNAATSGDIVATWSGLAANACLAAEAVDLLNANTLDQTVGNTGSGTTISSGSTTTTANNEYLHGLIYVFAPNFNQSYTVSWQNGFAEAQAQWANEGVAELSQGYRIVSATGTYAAAGTVPKPASWVALLATFR